MVRSFAFWKSCFSGCRQSLEGELESCWSQPQELLLAFPQREAPLAPPVPRLIFEQADGWGSPLLPHSMIFRAEKNSYSYFCGGAAGSILRIAAKKILLYVWAHKASRSLTGTDTPEELSQTSHSTHQNSCDKEQCLGFPVNLSAVGCLLRNPLLRSYVVTYN